MFYKNKKLIAALLFAIVIAAVFWSQSRIPALNEKAQMGLRTNFGEIAFEILLPVSSEQNFIERVIKSSINWAYTNLFGMTFGLLFAAAILTILNNLKSRSFKSPWLNTLSGIFIGAPLGVCVNCATPIAFGLYSAGARLETALATLIASPTLNIIVLTMSFTLLPWEMALSKLIATFIILLSIPFIIKFLLNKNNLKPIPITPQNYFTQNINSCPIERQLDINESFIDAVIATIQDFIKNLYFIVKFALPLMLLAGFLGALVLEIVPFNLFENTHASILLIIACALISTILPVPIAFDVIIVMALLSSGIDKGIATVLLLSLGIYSIYPAFVIARYISLRLSLSIALIVIILSSIFGISLQSYFEFKDKDEQQLIIKGIADSSEDIYKNVIQVCNSLPQHLQTLCFERNITHFKGIVPHEKICLTRPSNLDKSTCDLKLKTFVSKKKAVSSEDTSVCFNLKHEKSRASCMYYSTTKIAINNYDINFCDKLQHSEAISTCKTEYLNTNLLFNPDGSACKGLNEEELNYCLINAEIYKLTDSLNIEDCNQFNNIGAGEHCRYKVASAMIGRHNDSSGCASLKSVELKKRCKNLTVSWQATNKTSSELCLSLEEEDLKNLCLIKVADKKINLLLTQYSIALPENTYKVIASENKIIKKTNISFEEAPSLKWTTILTNDQIDIAFSPYTDSAVNNLNSFEKIAAHTIGITKYWEFRATDFFEPFIIGKGIASGDFNNDFWPDFVLATEQGAAIYKNIGGKFELININQAEMQKANLFLISLVDADNDGYQDIFASSYGGTNYLLKNIDGDFKKTKLTTFNGDHRLTLSAGFGDLNQNGKLDIVLGNWSSGVEKLFDSKHSNNIIMYRESNSYRVEEQNTIKGETNSVLVSDINNDNLTDVVIANDRLVPDIYYINKGKGILKPISPDSNIIPLSSMFTMSTDSADFNNDLKIDLFSTDMTFSRSSRNNYCSSIEEPSAKAQCKRILLTYKDFQENSAVSCRKIDNLLERQDCYISFSIKAAKELKDQNFCSKIIDKNSEVYSLCSYLASPSSPEESNNQSPSIKQTQRNTLLIQENNRFVEQAEDFGVTSSYWSWNAKAADLDNDGWQDIYVGNGFHFGDNFYEIQENILFHNINGKYFEETQSEWNLNDTINTPSYTYLDIDLDGDLDIISTGVLAPPRVYINHLEKKNSITFAIVDEKENSFGIGTKITVHYGGKKRLKQRKENKLSGGFMSFNNPVLHFGLAEYTAIDKLEIQWPDGSTFSYDEPLAASGIYRIQRSTTVSD